jgi:hypothetical protein
MKLLGREFLTFARSISPFSGAPRFVQWKLIAEREKESMAYTQVPFATLDMTPFRMDKFERGNGHVRQSLEQRLASLLSILRCTALRTVVAKDGAACLQAGDCIVSGTVELDEERSHTSVQAVSVQRGKINKLRSNIKSTIGRGKH